MGYNKSNTVFSETTQKKGETTVKHSLSRICAAALGIYLALGMSRAAVDLLAETKRIASLQEACSRIKAEISDIQATASMTDDAVRQWAFQQEGMVSSDDVVFFDGG